MLELRREFLLQRRALPGQRVRCHRVDCHHGGHGVMPVPTEGGDKIRACHEQRRRDGRREAQPCGEGRQHRVGVDPLRRVVHGEMPPVGRVDQHPAGAGWTKMTVTKLGDGKRRQTLQRQLDLRRDPGRERLRWQRHDAHEKGVVRQQHDLFRHGAGWFEFLQDAHGDADWLGAAAPTISSFSRISRRVKG